jgi:hypothetical protein
MRRLLALLVAVFASPSDQKNSGKSSATLTLPQ